MRIVDSQWLRAVMDLSSGSSSGLHAIRFALIYQSFWNFKRNGSCHIMKACLICMLYLYTYLNNSPETRKKVQHFNILIFLSNCISFLKAYSLLPFNFDACLALDFWLQGLRWVFQQISSIIYGFLIKFECSKTNARGYHWRLSVAVSCCTLWNSIILFYCIMRGKFLLMPRPVMKFLKSFMTVQWVVIVELIKHKMPFPKDITGQTSQQK